jgi:SAM-dependent methyltransferase
MSKSFSPASQVYRDPRGKHALREGEGGWVAADGRSYPLITVHGQTIPVFTGLGSASEAHAEGMYDTQHDTEVYRNFLIWLYATFGEDESHFRQALVTKLQLKEGDRLLITGCGLGDDIVPVVDAFGAHVQVFASDLSPAMVSQAASLLDERGVLQRGAVSLSVADAGELPFADGTFDAAFHFGGINLFDDPKGGIAEMTRVVKEGGRVVFGDEGVAPWLKGSDYARMVVANNPLWDADSLITQLPFSAVNVNLSWVLGNCFYLIDYDKRIDGPRINPDVRHLGYKGGTMRTRHAGRVEGISPALREKLYDHAKASGVSVHDFLESAITQKLAERAG